MKLKEAEEARKKAEEDEAGWEQMASWDFGISFWNKFWQKYLKESKIKYI